MLRILSFSVPVVLVLFLAAIGHTEAQTNTQCSCCGCPNGWVYFEGSCYLFGDDDPTYSWTEAAHHCEIHHSHLVVIDSAREDTFIKSFLKRLIRHEADRDSTTFWAGATDEVTEGLWVWYTDDSPLEYTNWYPGQPESSEDCLCLLHKNYDWHDCMCAEIAFGHYKFSMTSNFTPDVKSGRQHKAQSIDLKVGPCTWKITALVIVLWV